MQQIPIPILRRFNMKINIKYPAEIWFLLLIVVGYTFFSAFATPFSIENTRIFSLPYRVLILIFSVYIIYKNFSLQKFKNIAVYSILLFWFFYFIKSYISFTNDFYEAKFAKTFSEIYVRIIIIVLVPSLALLFINYKKLDLSIVAKGFFYVLLLMLSLNFIYAISTPYIVYMNFIFSMYYISYGHLGASLTIVSLFLLLFKQKEMSRNILIYGLFLGLATIVIAGARSPFLAIMLVIPYLLILHKNYKLILLYLALLLVSIIAIYILGKDGNQDFIFATRTYNWLFKGDTSLRMPLFQHATEIFKSNVFLGGRTLYKDGMYPHNIFLELLMATGFLGFIIYFLKFIPVIKNYFLFTTKIKNTKHIFFFAIFLQYFILVFTSYSIYAVPEFLYFSSIIIGISLNNQNEEIESNDGCRNSSRNN